MKKKTKEQFITEAQKVHGDKYDYSKVEYVNAKTKVCIICPIHGEFYQTPDHHLRAYGCPDCGDNNKKLTTEQFIEKSIEKHGNKYDYSKVNYVNGKTKVCIICHIHGEFYQRPDHHLGGQGCPDCGENKKTTEDFIKEVIEIHGNKYDYSKVEYVNTKTKICIICPEHGEFYQTPENHLQGKGCSDCGGTKKKTTEEFIEKSKEVHGDKYDYSKVEYVNGKTKVCIICPEHGEFCQTPENHLTGYGCPDCGGSKRKTTEQFIKEAQKVHGDKYDYSKVNYVNRMTKVCIKCSEHGEFWQISSNHLKGCGCPKCNSSKLEEEVKNCFPEFEQQKTFDWLRDKKPLRLDFYDEDLKLGIECQGEQHFTIVDRFGGEEEFEKRLKLDKLKYEQCQEHGIDVVYYFLEDFSRYDLDFYKDKICFYNPEDLFTFIRNRKNAKKINN
jgi:predicted  nucleic acid-binding Zn-ribbon protein